MIDAATPGLRRSTVNEEGDNQAVSAYRNSQVLPDSSSSVCRSCLILFLQAANVMANWRDKVDPVARVLRRTFSFANWHGLGLSVDGQEPFSVIQ